MKWESVGKFPSSCFEKKLAGHKLSVWCLSKFAPWRASWCGVEFALEAKTEDAAKVEAIALLRKMCQDVLKELP